METSYPTERFAVATKNDTFISTTSDTVLAPAGYENQVSNQFEITDRFGYMTGDAYAHFVRVASGDQEAVTLRTPDTSRSLLALLAQVEQTEALEALEGGW